MSAPPMALTAKDIARGLSMFEIDESLAAPEVPIAVGLPTWDDCAARILDIYRLALT